MNLVACLSTALLVFLAGASHAEPQLLQVSAEKDALLFTVEGDGGPVSLHAVQPFVGGTAGGPVPAGALPLWQGLAEGQTVRLPRHHEGKDLIYHKFVLAHEGNLCGEARFVTDLDGLPKPGFSLPWPGTLKGVSAPRIKEDVVALGGGHVALNFMLPSMFDLRKTDAEEVWEADGVRYPINQDAVRSYDEKIRFYTDAGMSVTLIVLNLIPRHPDPDNPFVHPLTDLPETDFPLGAFNTTSEAGVRAYRAALEFTADRYSRPDGKYGWVHGYIIGNELNAHWVWHNIGRMELPGFVEQYGLSLRIADLAVRQAHPDARVYVSLEHHWTATYDADPAKGFGAKPFLEQLTAWSRRGGDFPWAVAFHPYPENLYDPETWEDRQAVASYLSPKVTFRNIEVLTRFLDEEALQYAGQPRRLIFSEQGFQTLVAEDGEDLQAAAYAYSWEKAKRLDNLDAYMYFSQLDFDWPGGLRVGLWTQEKDERGRSHAGKKKRIHGLVQAADTPGWEEAAAFALPIIGADSWAEAMAVPEIERAPLLFPELTLVDGGATSWAIYIPEQGAPAHAYAARELRHFIEEMSGVTLPIQRGEAAPGAHNITLRIDRDDARLQEDGVAIEAVPSAHRVVLTGQNERGVIYSVYTLLERYLGVRFLAGDCTVVPRRGKVSLPAIDYAHSSPFMYRETLYFDSFPKEISVRQRLNGPQSRCDAEVGGKWAFHPYVHSFWQLVPEDQYFEEHPEYYSLQNGERKAGHIHAQLCLTNPDVLDIATRQVLRWIEENPEVPIIDVSQNDGQGWCECENCMAVVEEEGSQHGPILRFVNAIADVVAEKYPDKWIETLAYAYATKPPEKTLPRDNVIIRLCHAGCYFHGFEDCGLGANLTSYLDQWRERTRRIFIWHYAANFAHYVAPNQNLRGLAKDIKYYAGHGVNGLMVQSDYQGSGGELAELRQYLAAQLMWDPDQNAERIILDFCLGYYGEAAPDVLEYLALLDQAAEDPNIHAFGAWDPKGTASPSLVTEGLIILTRALGTAKDETTRHRVEKLFMPLWYMQLTYPDEYGLAPEQAPMLAGEFERVAKESKATYISEIKAMDVWLNEMKTRHGKDAQGLVYDLYRHLGDAKVENSLDWRAASLLRSGGMPGEKAQAGDAQDAIMPDAAERDGANDLMYSIFHHPPDKGHGDATFQIPLPTLKDGETLAFEFGTGISADSPDGVTFAVLVNGEEAWEHHQQTRAVANHGIGLSPWQGKTVALTLRVSAGEDKLKDWANWVLPRVVCRTANTAPKAP